MNRAAIKVANDDDGEVIGYMPISMLPRKGDTISIFSKKICRASDPAVMVVDDVFWEVDFEETDAPPEDDINVSVGPRGARRSDDLLRVRDAGAG